MSEAKHQLDSTLPKPRLCTACGRPMRLASIEPDNNYINLDRRTFSCDCGRSMYDLVAHPEN